MKIQIKIGTGRIGFSSWDIIFLENKTRVIYSEKNIRFVVRDCKIDLERIRRIVSRLFSLNMFSEFSFSSRIDGDMTKAKESQRIATEKFALGGMSYSEFKKGYSEYGEAHFTRIIGEIVKEERRRQNEN